jgi:lipocalin
MNHMRYFIVSSLAFMLLVLLIAVFTGCRSSRQPVDLTPLDNVDLPRYIGQWYEIARFDHWFERGMTHTKASYTMREDGDIQVVNTGLKDGKVKTSTGRAKRADKHGLLRVSFFWPFYGDYRILWVDENYQYALVGGDGSEYLWILSRTTAVNPTVKRLILTEAKHRGYDADKLIWVEQ